MRCCWRQRESGYFAGHWASVDLADTHSYSDTNSHTDANSDAYAHADANSDAHAHANPDANSDTDAITNAGAAAFGRLRLRSSRAGVE